MTTTKRKPAEAAGQPTRTDGIGEGQIAQHEPPREAERATKRVIILPWPSPALSPNSRPRQSDDTRQSWPQYGCSIGMRS